MKKIFSFLLCIILIFLCVSCAAADEIVPEYDSGMSEDSIDLKGDTYVMGMVQDYFFEQDSTLSYINNTELGDLPDAPNDRIQRCLDRQACRRNHLHADCLLLYQTAAGPQHEREDAHASGRDRL